MGLGIKAWTCLCLTIQQLQAAFVFIMKNLSFTGHIRLSNYLPFELLCQDTVLAGECRSQVWEHLRSCQVMVPAGIRVDQVWRWSRLGQSLEPRTKIGYRMIGAGLQHEPVHIKAGTMGWLG